MAQQPLGVKRLSDEDYRYFFDLALELTRQEWGAERRRMQARIHQLEQALAEKNQGANVVPFAPPAAK